VHKCSVGGNEEAGARLFSGTPTERTGGNGCKLKHIKFPLNTHTHTHTRTHARTHTHTHTHTHRFLTVRVAEHWHRLPRDVMESLPMEIFKLQMDIVLDNLL